jgi:hypothetical protein
MAQQLTQVGLRGDMTINDKPVAVNAIFGKEVLVQIQEEFSIGSPISFAYWLKEKWQVDGPGMDVLLINNSSGDKKQYEADEFKRLDQKTKESEVKLHLTAKGIPGPAVNMMATALLAEVLITDLLVQLKEIKIGDKSESEKILKLGLAINFGMPLNILPGIDINRISLFIKSAPENRFDEVFADDSKLAKLPAPARLMEAASGYIVFSGPPANNSKITLGGKNWTFVSGESDPAQQRTKTIPNDVKSTVMQLAKDLSEVTSEPIAACQYECAVVDDKPRLVVKYRTAGVRGNDFTLAVDPTANDPKSNGVASGGKLSRGTSPLGERASGSITFKFDPQIADNAPIKIFKKDLTVKKATSSAELTAAITDLAVKLNTPNSSPIAADDYIWQANGSRLDFAAKKVGEKNGDVLEAQPPAFVDGKPVFYAGADPQPG